MIKPRLSLKSFLRKQDLILLSLRVSYSWWCCGVFSALDAVRKGNVSVWGFWVFRVGTQLSAQLKESSSSCQFQSWSNLSTEEPWRVCGRNSSYWCELQRGRRAACANSGIILCRDRLRRGLEAHATKTAFTYLLRQECIQQDHSNLITGAMWVPRLRPNLGAVLRDQILPRPWHHCGRRQSRPYCSIGRPFPLHLFEGVAVICINWTPKFSYSRRSWILWTTHPLHPKPVKIWWRSLRVVPILLFRALMG